MIRGWSKLSFILELRIWRLQIHAAGPSVLVWLWNIQVGGTMRGVKRALRTPGRIRNCLKPRSALLSSALPSFPELLESHVLHKSSLRPGGDMSTCLPSCGLNSIFLPATWMLSVDPVGRMTSAHPGSIANSLTDLHPGSRKACSRFRIQFHYPYNQD